MGPSRGEHRLTVYRAHASSTACSIAIRKVASWCAHGMRNAFRLPTIAFFFLKFIFWSLAMAPASAGVGGQAGRGRRGPLPMPFGVLASAG